MTACELSHGLRQYRGKPEVAERVLSALVEDGIGQWEPDHHGPKGGRPALRFRLVSTVTVTKTPTDTAKHGGFSDGATPTSAGDGWGEL